MYRIIAESTKDPQFLPGASDVAFGFLVKTFLKDLETASWVLLKDLETASCEVLKDFETASFAEDAVDLGDESCSGNESSTTSALVPDGSAVDSFPTPA